MELHLDDERIALRGSGAGNAGRPTRRATPGRVCGEDDCDTRLSIYNRSTRCWQHEQPRKYFPVHGGRRAPAPRAPAGFDVPDLDVSA